METRPSKVVEAIVYWLVPPACREEVLGDMRERNADSVQYLIEAAHTIPAVIYSRVRRTMDPLLVLMEAVSLYTTYVIASWWLNHQFLVREYGYPRLVVPPALFLMILALADAYSDPRKRWTGKVLLGPMLGFVFTYVLELGEFRALPAAVLSWGGAFGVLAVSMIRLTFLSATDQLQTTNIPLFWQKLELVPFSLKLDRAFLPCAILLAIILYLFIKRP